MFWEWTSKINISAPKIQTQKIKELKKVWLPPKRYFNLIDEGCDDDMLKRDKVVGGGAKGDTSTLAPTCGQAGLTYHNS